MTKKERNGKLRKSLMMDQPLRDASSNSSWSQSSDSAETSWTTTEMPSSKCWAILKLHSRLMRKNSLESHSSNSFSKNGSTLLMPYWKWLSWSYPHPSKLKVTELPTCMKDPSMTHAVKPLRTATKTVLLWSSSQRWCPPTIKVDSMPSVEFSQEKSKLDKKSELWDPTTPQDPRTIWTSRVSKELCSWWEEKSKLSQKYHAVTLLDWSE